MQNQSATPEQADTLRTRLDTWEALLVQLETRPARSQDTTQLTMSRRILENYRRTLARDLRRGLARVPAGELFRAISTAEASIGRLEVLRDAPEVE